MIAPPVCSETKPAAKWSSLLRSLPASRSLRSLDLDVTEACNLACIYCFKWQKKAVNMDAQTAKAAIDWLVEASGPARDLKVNLMGGEPTIRFDLVREIVPYGKLRARQRGKSMHFGCTTNGTLITDDLVGFWRRYGMGFHCSIDGIPEVQNQNRPFLGGKGSAEAVERGVKKILSYRPEVMARATLSPASVRALCDSAKYLVSLGFRSITFKIAANCDWQDSDFKELSRQYGLLAEFYVQCLRTGKALRIEEFDKGMEAISTPSVASGRTCGAGCGVALVDPRGDLWPCHRFGPHQCGGGFKLGSLGLPFEDRIRNVFLGFNQVRDETAGCRTCSASFMCRSWCHAECVDAGESFYNPGAKYCRALRIISEQVLFFYDRLRTDFPAIFKQKVSHDVKAS